MLFKQGSLFKVIQIIFSECTKLHNSMKTISYFSFIESCDEGSNSNTNQANSWGKKSLYESNRDIKSRDLTTFET